MRADIFQMIPQYGRDVKIISAKSPAGRTERGILQPIGRGESSGERKTHTMPGVRQNRRFRLFMLPDAISREEACASVVCDGEEYELLQIDAYVVGNVQTHWEGILRLKGAVPYD